MKSTSKIIIITFAVLLTGLVHITVGEPKDKKVLADFNVFVERLETILKSPDARVDLRSANLFISDVAKERLIDDFKKTSFEFKKRCAVHCRNPDMLKLLKTDVVDLFFGCLETRFKNRHMPAMRDLVIGIKRLDPIGFMAYLAQNNVTENAENMAKHLEDYKRKMADVLVFTSDISLYYAGGTSTTSGRNPESSATR